MNIDVPTMLDRFVRGAVKKSVLVLVLVSSIVCLNACDSCGNNASKAQKAGVVSAKMKLRVQWGGYYASRNEGEKQYTVFRLLDFNQFAYQAALYSEKFNELPTMEAVRSLRPSIRHAPIDSKALVRKGEIRLLGREPLVSEDLDGYRFYLEHFGSPKEEIERLFRDIIGYSRAEPLDLTLSIVDDRLYVEGLER